MKIEIEEEDFKFLKELAQRMIEQKETDWSDNRYPRVYGIMETEQVVIGDGYDSGWDYDDIIFTNIDSKAYDKEELFEYLLEEHHIKLPDDMDEEEIIDTLKDRFNLNYGLLYCKNVKKLKESGGLYLTKDYAVANCKSNAKVYQLDETKLGELGGVLEIIEKFKDMEVEL